MRSSAFLAASLALLPASAVAGLLPAQLPPRLYSCSTFTVGWVEDAGAPTAEEMGMVHVDLLRQGQLVQRLACTDASAPLVQLHIPCDVPASSDYAIRYTSATTSDALYAFGVTIHAPPPSLHIQVKRAAEASATTTPPPPLRRVRQDADSSSMTASTWTEVGTQPDGAVGPTTSYTSSQNTSSSDPTTAPIADTVVGSPTVRPTISRPTPPAVLTSGAMPSRAIGVHPGLVMLWAGLMCGMVLF